MSNSCQSDDSEKTGAAPEFTESHILELLQGVAATLHTIVNERTEIVVHDLRHPDSSVMSIFNGYVSGRTHHASILAGPHDDQAFDKLVHHIDGDSPQIATVVGNYTTHTRDGRELQSSTVIVRNVAGDPFAALCLNFDITGARQTERQIQALLYPSACPPVEKVEPGGTIDDLIEEIIESSVAACGVLPEMMTKAQKVEAVAAMNARGLFLIRRSVERVAKRFGITKFTIYNYLDEIGASRP